MYVRLDYTINSPQIIIEIDEKYSKSPNFNKYNLFFQVKIQGQNEEMLLAACEQFLGKNEEEIQQVGLIQLNL